MTNTERNRQSVWIEVIITPVKGWLFAGTVIYFAIHQLEKAGVTWAREVGAPTWEPVPYHNQSVGLTLAFPLALWPFAAIATAAVTWGLFAQFADGASRAIAAAWKWYVKFIEEACAAILLAWRHIVQWVIETASVIEREWSILVGEIETAFTDVRRSVSESWRSTSSRFDRNR